MTFDQAIQKMKEGYMIKHKSIDNENEGLGVYFRQQYINSDQWEISDEKINEDPC